MTTILFASHVDDPQAWREAMASRLPHAEFRVWPDTGDRADIEYALVWKFRGDDLDSYPNLKLICSLGAGVDHLIFEPRLPAGVPIVRIVDPAMTAGMSEYVALAVLRHHRQLPAYEAQQRARLWRALGRPPTEASPVGILGMGVLGRDAAAKLGALGFPVLGWSRRGRPVPNVETFAGEDGLAAMLARTRFLVCLLPLTAQTRGIVGARTLALLPRGAYVVNVARGAHVVDADLVAALDSGHIGGATLDVFAPEPLPAGHPFWAHPKVLVTPHVASLTDPATAADQVAENIRRRAAGLPLLNEVDPRAGY